MIVDGGQRWKERRGVYVHPDRTINPLRWEVAAIPDDRTARDFVVTHHYSGSFPAARRRFGLFGKGGALSGVVVISVPAQPKTLDVLPGDRDTCGELGRLVLLDEVPANGESWFVARAFETLRREGWTGIVSFSDPVPRTTADGAVLFKGHYGCVYQSLNAVYLGKSKPRLMRLLPDGSVLHERAIAKIRARDRGWRYACAVLERYGAIPLREDEDAAVWVRRWIPRLTRSTRHSGNLKYAWSLQKRDRRHLPACLPYPKLIGIPL